MISKKIIRKISHISRTTAFDVVFEKGKDPCIKLYIDAVMSAWKRRVETEHQRSKKMKKMYKL
jgi:hypothetical protein